MKEIPCGCNTDDCGGSSMMGSDCIKCPAYNPARDDRLGEED